MGRVQPSIGVTPDRDETRSAARPVTARPEQRREASGGKLTVAVRWLYGLAFLIFGLNGFFEFFSPPAVPPAGKEFLGALVQTGYMMPMVKGIEVIAGFMIILGVQVPLALLLLAPGVVNIFLFHLFLAPVGIPLALFLVFSETYLGYAYFPRFRPIFRA